MKQIHKSITKLLTLLLLLPALIGCSDKNIPDNTELQTDITEDSHVDKTVENKDIQDNTDKDITNNDNTDKVNMDKVNMDKNSTDMNMDANYFSDRDFDLEYNEEEAALILLNGDSASCTSDAVQITGSVLTILDEGTYILSGTLNDGMIVVNTEKTDKTRIILNGADIHSKTSAPICILQSDKVFITTVYNTTNTLSNGGSFSVIDDNDIDAVIFSKEDLTLNGEGLLAITSPAGHGIVSKDSLTITGGTYDIHCADRALSGKDDICIADGNFTIVSGKDGIHAENTDDPNLGYIYIQNGSFIVNAEGDGISAASTLQIADGDFRITSGGSSNDASMKGIKSTSDLLIQGGSFLIDSVDDSLHSNASATIQNGNFEISSGDDAFHADDTLTIHAGQFCIKESYEGLEGLHVNITGGEITLTAEDDGINAAGGRDASGMGGRDAAGRGGRFGHDFSSSDGSIRITGGTINITAYGDGIDANGTFEITNGFVTVCGPTRGDTATLDYDISGTITGGTFIGTGSSFMAQTFSDAEQGVIAIKAGNQAAGTTITLSDTEGNIILSHSPALDYIVVILSSPNIISGETYQLTIGTHSDKITAN